MESCKLAARWRWWDAGKRLLYAPRLLCCERSEAWKAERSGCKRERAGSTSMEASSFSAAGAPSTPLWTVGCGLPPYTGLEGCKLWQVGRNVTLLRGLGQLLHPILPAPHHSDHFRAVPADCGVFRPVPADSGRGRVSPQAARYTLPTSCGLQGATVGRVESVLYGTVKFFKWGV